MKNKVKEIIKYSKFSFIMCIITFLIGCYFSSTAIGVPIKAMLIILLISYIPFILFSIITLLVYRFKNKKKNLFILNIISGILSFLLLFYYFIAAFVIALLAAINPVTNIKYYKYYMNGTELTKVFPKKISDKVSNIQFYYAPGIFQGATNYSLYYIDQNMTKDKFDNNYKKNALWIGYKNDYTENEGLLTGAFSYTPAHYKNENDYIIYLIDGKCDDSGYCNHGKFILAAFNEKTKEVIFRAEYW